MLKYLLSFLLLLISRALFAQVTVSGIVTDSMSFSAVRGANVTVGDDHTVTDDNGRFALKRSSSSADTLSISAIGYRTLRVPVVVFKSGTTLSLSPQQTQLADVVINAGSNNPYRAISEADIRLRGISNSQEVLRIVPGLFIGQHQGGGKAEQIFLRGFDNDHGTDINLSVDGMPINMVSHAHGQGYADSHFIIPETIDNTVYEKGMYNATKGDLAVTGFVDFRTADAVKSQVKGEAGQYGTVRALAMLNLLDDKARRKGQSWYVASEYRYSDGYFDHTQLFKRFNFFTKYTARLNSNNNLSVSAGTAYSKWDASGQIPQNAVDNGTVGFYGQLDPNEGGRTARTNINAQLSTRLHNHDLIKNQLYYSYYDFDLFSNFTFLLIDSVNGDEITQREKRNMAGYNGSYIHEGYLGSSKWISEFGLNTRFDATRGSELSHTVKRYTLINPIKLGDINEWSAGAYLNETLDLSSRLSVTAGLRFDQFYYSYDNKLAADSTLHGAGLYTANNNVLSPKLKINYRVGSKAQFYFFAGKGFHSNDARVVVAQTSGNTLPSAYGADLGTVLKPVNNLIINAAVWYSKLHKEYVYAGDGGSVEFSGRTRRIGADLSARYQPVKSLYLDADLNYARGRSLDDLKGENYIPLAPVWSSTGGVTLMLTGGLNGSLRYRWLGNRAANEDYSLTANGYFINDLVINYTSKKYEVGLTVNNLFNVKWRETQFETLTRLRNEQPVNGIAFTAGTRFMALLHVTYLL